MADARRDVTGEVVVPRKLIEDVARILSANRTNFYRLTMDEAKEIDEIIDALRAKFPAQGEEPGLRELLAKALDVMRDFNGRRPDADIIAWVKSLADMLTVADSIDAALSRPAPSPRHAAEEVRDLRADV